MRFEGRTAHEAIGLAVQSAQRGLTCVSQAVVLASSRAIPYHTVTTGRVAEARMSGGYRLSVFEEYAPVAGDRSAVVLERIAYMYRVFSGDRELLAYHWDAAREGRPFPHLHLSVAAEVGNRLLTRAHIPTGELSLADVVRLLIEELGVRPRRADWRAVLAETVG